MDPFETVAFIVLIVVLAWLEGLRQIHRNLFIEKHFERRLRRQDELDEY